MSSKVWTGKQLAQEGKSGGFPRKLLCFGFLKRRYIFVQLLPFEGKPCAMSPVEVDGELRHVDIASLSTLKFS
jgi:hypothetical protein